MELPGLIKEVLIQLCPNNCYIVGGWVRDKYLNLESHDIDIVIEEDGSALRVCQELELLGFPYYQVGANYPIYKVIVNFNTPERFEIDICDTQSESFEDPTSRQRTTKYASLKDDIKRRDFTVNQLLWDITNDCYVDLSTSIIDLKESRLRQHPEVNPYNMFKDDPLRILRMIRFSILYGFSPTYELTTAALNSSYRINVISFERITKEIMKYDGIRIAGICYFIEMLNELNLLEYVFPNIYLQKNVLQRQDNGEFDIRNIHLEGETVFDHTIKCLWECNSDIVIQLGVLYHDVGKIPTRTVSEGKVQFLGHETVGIELAESDLLRLKIPLEIIEKVKLAIKYHMSIHNVIEAKSTRSIRRLIRELGENLNYILEIGRADYYGNDCGDKPDYNDLIKPILDQVEFMKIVPKKSIINGNKIMEVMNISKPCMLVGQIIKDMIEAQDNEEVTDESSALEWLKTYKSNQFV